MRRLKYLTQIGIATVFVKNGCHHKRTDGKNHEVSAIDVSYFIKLDRKSGG